LYEDDGQVKPLDSDVRILLFQALNELMVNVVKHAHARTVKVSLMKDGDFIRVGVEDDGSGFDVSSISSRMAKTCGYGLFSIRERLKYISGRMGVQSAPGCGTCVFMAAPLTFSNESAKAGPIAS
jgi:signal transduction histidine kinase